MKKFILFLLVMAIATYAANSMMLIPETDEEIYPSPVLIEEPVVVEIINSFDIGEGFVVIANVNVDPSSTGSLDAYILKLEQEMEAIENQRDSLNTAFENFDSKIDQLFNLMNNILKSIREMQQSIIRNLGY